MRVGSECECVCVCVSVCVGVGVGVEGGECLIEDYTKVLGWARIVSRTPSQSYGKLLKSFLFTVLESSLHC